MASAILSNRPYLLRAFYEWIVDNQWTPHLQVDALYPGIQIPRQFVQDDVIVFNVSPAAVMGLTMQNDDIAFKARFQGVEQVVRFPPEAVLAIFARENGQGMPFPRESYPADLAEEPPATASKKAAKKPTLSIVK